MSVIRWIGIGVEYTGKLLQQQQLEDWAKDAADRLIERLGDSDSQRPPAGDAASDDDDVSKRAKDEIRRSRENTISDIVSRLGSEPFQVAVEDAVKTLPNSIGRMIFWPVGSKKIGLVPLFALELAARKHFTTVLGKSAEADAAQDMIEFGLAADALEAIIKEVEENNQRSFWRILFKKNKNVSFPWHSEKLYILACEQKFRWDEKLRPGYVQVVHGSEAAYNSESWREIVSALGKMSSSGRDELIESWKEYIDLHGPKYNFSVSDKPPISLGRVQVWKR